MKTVKIIEKKNMATHQEKMKIRREEGYEKGGDDKQKGNRND
jgi:hypothetical protein